MNLLRQNFLLHSAKHGNRDDPDHRQWLTACGISPDLNLLLSTKCPRGWRTAPRRIDTSYQAPPMPPLRRSSAGTSADRKRPLAAAEGGLPSSCSSSRSSATSGATACWPAVAAAAAPSFFDPVNHHRRFHLSPPSERTRPLSEGRRSTMRRHGVPGTSRIAGAGCAPCPLLADRRSQRFLETRVL